MLHPNVLNEGGFHPLQTRSKFLEHFLHFIELEVDHAYGRRPPFMSPLIQENVMNPRR